MVSSDFWSNTSFLSSSDNLEGEQFSGSFSKRDRRDSNFTSKPFSSPAVTEFSIVCLGSISPVTGDKILLAKLRINASLT